MRSALHPIAAVTESREIARIASAKCHKRTCGMAEIFPDVRQFRHVRNQQSEQFMGHNVPLILDKKNIRKLTPRECFNFQGFPKSFKLPKELANNQLYKQAGNAVTVPLVKKIAVAIKKTLED